MNFQPLPPDRKRHSPEESHTCREESHIRREDNNTHFLETSPLDRFVPPVRTDAVRYHLKRKPQLILIAHLKVILLLYRRTLEDAAM